MTKRVKVDMQAPVNEIASLIADAAAKAAEREQLTVAQVVDLVVQDVLNHEWVDEELRCSIAESLCIMFNNYVEAVNVPTED